MRFKINIILITALLMLLGLNSISYSAEWNLLDELKHTSLVAPATIDESFPVVVGDFVGDSNEDMAIGDEATDTVYILTGDGTTFAIVPSVTITFSVTGKEFGAALSTIPDIGGDGKDELLIGAPAQASLSAYLYRSEELVGAQLTEANASVQFIETVAETFGVKVACGGDVDNDNIPEILISNDGANSTVDFVDIYFGSTVKAAITAAIAGSGLPALISNSPSLTFSAGTQTTTFGAAIGSAGDIDGDGFGDIYISDPISRAGTTETGDVFIYKGSGAMDATADLIITGIAYRDFSTPPTYSATAFGESVAGDFDIDNDGFSDLIIGAPTSGTHASGQAFLYFGSSTLSDIIDSNNIITFNAEGPKGQDNFGKVVTKLNANGDAYDDIVISAPGAKDGGTGRAYYIAGEGTRANLTNFDNVIIGSYTTATGATGEGLSYITAAGASDLYLFSYETRLIKHCAITNTPSNTIGGIIGPTNNTLTAGTYYVRSDIIVPIGVTFTLDPGVTLSFNSIKFSVSGFSEEHLELNVFGSLVANGTSTNKITFNMNRISSDTSPGGWMGINLEDKSTASFKNCNVLYGLNGIWVDRASITLEDSIISYSGGNFVPLLSCDDSFSCSPSVGNGVYAKSALFTPFTNNNISYNLGDGVSVESPSDAEVDPGNVLDSIIGCTFVGNGGSGFSNGDADMIIDTVLNNTFSSNASEGIKGLTGTYISGNTFSSNTGTGAVVSECTVSGNRFTANGSAGLDSADSVISNNVFINHFGDSGSAGAKISEGTFTNNYVGVDSNGTVAPNTTGVFVSGRVDVSQNIISENIFDGVVWDSNPADSESPGIFWQNVSTNNGDNGIWLIDASPKIVGNDITDNGSRGSPTYMNGIKIDMDSKPIISQNNLNSNVEFALMLTQTAPGNLNEPYTISTSGNWWGTTDTTAIYRTIWDSGDDITLLGTVLISPASGPITIANVPKPTSGGAAQQSIIDCFIASASYDDARIKKEDKKNFLNGLFRAFERVIFNKKNCTNLSSNK